MKSSSQLVAAFTLATSCVAGEGIGNKLTYGRQNLQIRHTASTPATLASVCTPAYVNNSIPHGISYLAHTSIELNLQSVFANPVTNVSVKGQNFFPDGTFDYCNVTLSYTHPGRNDTVNVAYWLPAPSAFKRRYLATGGGGYAINSGTGATGSLPGGIVYGAAAGLTDGGFGGFSKNFDAVTPIVNGTQNREALYMFGYEAIHEMTLLGQKLTKSFFNMTSSDKLYSYYQGCSEGGRDGWSQVQRFVSFDGVITGAPAFRFAHQQVQHMYSNVVEQTVGYYPPPCELQKIVNATLEFCDPLDGLTDGVVSRTDLCKLHFNISSLLGTPYSCGPTAPAPFPPHPAWPAHNGTITAKGIEVAQTILNGTYDSAGKLVYFSYQPSSIFADAYTQYNSTLNEFVLLIGTFGTEYVTRFLQLLNTNVIPDAEFATYTYDTLREFMYKGWQKYDDVLQTTWPDLTHYHNHGGKILHFHGESDFSIPTASSVHYHESVRNVMYGNMTFNESSAALSDWYQLYLIPGAQHCAPNVYEPNGPFPQTNLGVLIDWVESGVKPTTLNATHLAGPDKGKNAQICAWPLRPLWAANGTMSCVYDQASIDTWIYDLDAFKMPVY